MPAILFVNNILFREGNRLAVELIVLYEPLDEEELLMLVGDVGVAATRYGLPDVHHAGNLFGREAFHLLDLYLYRAFLDLDALGSLRAFG